MPAASSDTVTVVPVPSVVMLPGDRVSIQVPLDGNPARLIIPVLTSHEGWVIVPMEGAPGTSGGLLNITSAEFPEVQPPAFVTVK